jgi:hypothetical protein
LRNEKDEMEVGFGKRRIKENCCWFGKRAISGEKKERELDAELREQCLCVW